MDSNLSGVVAEITPDGTWDSKSGTTYYAYIVKMVDGTTGQHSDSRYTDVLALPFAVGHAVTYKYMASKYPKIEDIVSQGPAEGIQPNTGFNDQAPAAQAPAPRPAPGPGPGQYNKELNIVRESCIGSAARIYANRSSYGALEVLKLAQVFEAYVLTGAVPQEGSDDLPF